MALIETFAGKTPRRRAEARQAALMTLAVFPACLAVAATSRLAGRRGGGTRVSVWEEARGSAAACIAYAFR